MTKYTHKLISYFFFKTFLACKKKIAILSNIMLLTGSTKHLLSHMFYIVRML